ncbi:lytic transglycosylase domain-containing protein [Novosphingobium piscinae]|uniref:Lytic transglycosylase domain-containing protein n=2 Tax=Novosphingobium piscinae TaxID=1507448 RepID=A0A7X1G1D1_9SPHN|nr:lytic transglycosylase domain-containing protein [Novosphingobium piscinae]
MVPAVAARGQVVEIDSRGRVFVPRGTAAGLWAGEPPAADQPAAAGTTGPAPASDGLPAAAVTILGATPAPSVYREALDRAANHAAISPDLLATLVWQESRWNSRARSPAGAIGLGQLMPGTARQLGVNPHDPAQNLIGAATYLRQQLDRFDNNIELALAAYNAGPRRVSRAGTVPAIAETRTYVASITGRLAARAQGD